MANPDGPLHRHNRQAARERARFTGSQDITSAEERLDIAEWLLELSGIDLTEHAYHGPWRKVGRCHYCVCGQRMGEIGRV